MCFMDKEQQLNTDPTPSITHKTQCADSENDQSYVPSTGGDNPAEAVLSSVAYIILIIGILVSVGIGLLLIMDNYEEDRKLGWIILIGGLVSSIIVWASLMILINISNNVRQIKYELQNMKL